jgi:hypothetical protein
MIECPSHGPVGVHEITSLEDRQPRYLCEFGHYFSSSMMFRRHRYSPPLMVIKSWPLADRWTDLEISEPVSGKTFTQEFVYCGPSAPLPMPPKPEEILEGAGFVDGVYQGWRW